MPTTLPSAGSASTVSGQCFATISGRAVAGYDCNQIPDLRVLLRAQHNSLAQGSEFTIR
jgi:hypothetical protein